jgi:HSP20 family protein
MENEYYGGDNLQGVDVPVPDNQLPQVDVELARASSGAVASRSTRHAAPMPIAADDDGPRNESEGWLTIDVYQTPQDIVVESAVAGVNPDELDITATTDSIAIKGERRRSKEVKDGDYLYQECYWGKFSRSVILPQEVDPDNATVDFKNGILTVHLPKVMKQKSKKLKVRAS